MVKSRQETAALRGGRELFADDKQFINSLAKGLELLRAFEPGRGVLGNSELAAICGLPKATIARLTYTLVRLGYLDIIPGVNKYRLAAGVLAIGHSYLGTQYVRSIAAPLLADLAARNDVTAALGVRDRMDIVYIELAYGRSLRAMRLNVGSRVPLDRSAIGLAYIASVDESLRSAVLLDIEQNDPDGWPQAANRIESARREFERSGFCRSAGTLDRNIVAAGAPVPGLPGAPPMVINVAAPSFGAHERGISDEIGHQLLATAEAIGEGMIRRGEIY